MAIKVPSRSFYHEHPETLVVETRVIESRPGRVLLAHSPFFPGGGGQLADRGVMRWVGGEETINRFEITKDGIWHLVARPDAEVVGTVEAPVAASFRRLMREPHTASHILNAVVFKAFDGGLVTGAQMAADGTARMDFDLPGAKNDRLRELEAELNDAIQARPCCR